MRCVAALAPLLGALALAGCGSDDPETVIPLRDRPVEYRGAHAICSIGSVTYVAQRYGVDEATPEAVAAAAARAVGATSKQSAELARAGCLEAIAARDARGPGNETP
ncbi:MAG TPA: hypothetical protein VNI55_10565 [Gaiellaceae bacterium]|nr:hypothetical protein [Gaiellaceae bacterium]